MGRSVRNEWLRLPDTELLRQCREERYKASGPGGQRRNKVTTALRLHHQPSGVVAQAEESRSLEENRRRAVRRLRKRIALEVREAFDAGSVAARELAGYASEEGRMRVNERNAAYPLVLAAALDALASAGGGFVEAAKLLGLTTSQLLRFLESDREVWRAVSQRRAEKSA